MRSYAVIFEQAVEGGWGAYAPDLIRDGIVLYIESLREKDEQIPEPLSRVELVEVA